MRVAWLHPVLRHGSRRQCGNGRKKRGGCNYRLSEKVHYCPREFGLQAASIRIAYARLLDPISRKAGLRHFYGKRSKSLKFAQRSVALMKRG
jgi:hypothetical protein